jgi:uncharacterized protein (DUF362 family)
LPNPFPCPDVHVTACENYDPLRLRAALKEAFSAHGFLPPGTSPARVLIKPNLLRGATPARAVTTHPALIVEAVRALREGGHEVTVADSPAIGTARGNLRAMGCLEAIGALGARVSTLGDATEVRLPTGRLLPVSRCALEMDVILNLPKWKTHVQVGMTGAVKNLFGCVPGPRKAMQHIAYGHREGEFLEMLIGLAALLRPSLTVVDGVVAMEGDGPGGGTPRPCGWIFSGRDPVALDRVLASLMGFEEMGMFQTARSLGVGESDPTRIPLRGHPLPPRLDPPFRLPAPRPLSFHPFHRLLALARQRKRDFIL